MIAAPLATRWYVAQTLPHSERKAAEHLARQGFTVYLPCYQKRRRHARRVETVLAPLFPRYLFVAVDVNAQRWRSIQSTFGVAHLVCCGDAPMPLPDQVVAQIKAREDENGFIRLNTRRFAPGDKIQILDGAFSACQGFFEAITDDARVSVLLEFLGRKVRLVLDEDVVEAA